MDAMVCRSQDRSTMGAVAVGHEDWALAEEGDEWQVHARFKCRTARGEADKTRSDGSREEGVDDGRGGRVCWVRGEGTSNEEERMFSVAD